LSVEVFSAPLLITNSESGVLINTPSFDNDVIEDVISAWSNPTDILKYVDDARIAALTVSWSVSADGPRRCLKFYVPYHQWSTFTHGQQTKAQDHIEGQISDGMLKNLDLLVGYEWKRAHAKPVAGKHAHIYICWNEAEYEKEATAAAERG